mmetsp:Transcript_29652/g.53619  ORF Transcript_29652/g.53619 Transcript_29652/m.53619 type:complete len:215 (-) Transcript_29652:47-691(-)
MMNRRILCLLGAAAAACVPVSHAFIHPSLSVKPTSSVPKSAMCLSATSPDNIDASLLPTETSRRQVLLSTAVTMAGMILSTGAAHATVSPESLIADLELSLDKLKPIPSLLEKQEWDGVRTILKTPPVNQLWNLGDAKNTILQLAKATDEYELIDIKDELSLSLQMCDQLTYDNVFVYYQPGNGKIKVKEPVELAEKAMKQLSQAIDMAKSAVN